MRRRRLMGHVIGIIGGFLLGVPLALAAGGDLTCLIQPKAVITITTPVAGLLETLSVDRGDLVKEDQILAVIDTSVERATGAVQYAHAELTNKHLADLELQRTSAEINLRTMRSPITGVVVERFMSQGEFSKQDKILKLAQIDPLYVEVFAPVSMLGKVSVGQSAQIKPEAPVGGSYTAKITVVDRVVDAASGTFGVRLEIRNPDYKLPAGLKCNVQFTKN